MKARIIDTREQLEADVNGYLTEYEKDHRLLGNVIMEALTEWVGNNA